jgi:predicted transcriptional regulator
VTEVEKPPTSHRDDGDDIVYSSAWLTRVGEAVRQRRLDLELTQREVARRAGLAVNTGSQLERGQNWPRETNQRKLEMALQWPPGALTALRRGEPVPQVPASAPVTQIKPSMLGVVRPFVTAAILCMDILAGQNSEPEIAKARLDDAVHAMEALLAAVLPDAGPAFSDILAALEQLHAIRDEGATPTENQGSEIATGQGGRAGSWIATTLFAGADHVQTLKTVPPGERS